jgi:hypothetical protein
VCEKELQKSTRLSLRMQAQRYGLVFAFFFFKKKNKQLEAEKAIMTAITSHFLNIV